MSTISDSILATSIETLSDRAIERDKKDTGERSMADTVKTFNALTGLSLTEAQGWQFMIILKLVRGQQGNVRRDDYVDLASYSALLGECKIMNEEKHSEYSE